MAAGLGINMNLAAATPPKRPARSPRRPPSSLATRTNATNPPSGQTDSPCDGSHGPSSSDSLHLHAPDSDHYVSKPAHTNGEEALTHDQLEPLCNRGTSTESGFSRHDSLFSFHASSKRNAAELRSLLGNTHSRLAPGATVLSLESGLIHKDEIKAHAVFLEQAKPRARVEVDIVLESDCCVQGGYLRGNVKIRVRKRGKKESPVLLADGKVRVIGFECVPGVADRHTFYQCAGSLASITADGYPGIFDAPSDAEGFARAMEGVHLLPFAMLLPEDNSFGSAKGTADLPAGVSVRYIALVSIKVKDALTSKRSIAHFYRDCEVWPRIDPGVALTPAPRPLQASTAKALSMLGGGGKVRLSAMLHRQIWFAGQRCYVRVSVENETKKTVRSVTLTLVRSVTTFKPNPALEAGIDFPIDQDPCAPSTVHKVVAETVLEMAQSASKGHASAKGWWTGISPSQELQFAHCILIPPDALSIPRSRLLEVEYFIQVTASAGALTSDVHVTLPVRIVNLLSIDPPPTEPLLSHDGSYTRLVPRIHTASRSNVCSQNAPTWTSADLMSGEPRPGLSTLYPHGSFTGVHYSDTAGARSPPPMSKSFSRSQSTPHSSIDNSKSTIVSRTRSADSHGGAESDTDEDTESPRGLGNLDLEDGIKSEDEDELVMGTALLDAGCFPPASRASDSDCSSDADTPRRSTRPSSTSTLAESEASDDSGGDSTGSEEERGRSRTIRRSISGYYGGKATKRAGLLVEDDDATPRMRSGFPPTAITTRRTEERSDDEPSAPFSPRRLPVPPARSYDGIPASVSALESLRVSQLGLSEGLPTDRSRPTPGCRSSTSHYPVGGKVRLADAPRGARDGPPPVSASKSAGAIPRPQGGPSLVKGRIAAFEERVKTSGA